MLGLVCTLLVAAAMSVAGYRVAARLFCGLDPAESLALGGALGLGLSGLVILGFGLVGVLSPLVLLIPFLVLLAAGGKGSWPKVHVPSANGVVNILALGALALTATIAVLAPSDMRDWDTLAYHLAVPKIWLEAGRVGFVQGIHHSNFPFTADMLYLPGLQWGGQAGAKAFSLVWLLLGSVALFGIARRWYGVGPGWWAALVFAGCPVVLWESGTAYIDIPHGLFAGLAVLYLAEALSEGEPKFWILSGLCLGFAMGTKHTGLQTFGAVVLVAAVFLLIQKHGKGVGFKGLAIALALALLTAAPWYAKSAAYTGNPVYPFFFKQLGGKYWDQWRSDIYTREQKTFGVGTSPTNLGHAMLGLAYQPGRYVNPGQSEGRGFPTGAIGFVGLLGGLLWSASGLAGRKEKVVLAAVGVSLLAWFVLSQQSRYLTSIVVPLAVLAGGGVSRLKLGKVLAVGVGVQAAYSCWMLWTLQTGDQWQVVSGTVSQADYQAQRVPFFAPAQAINQIPGRVKVALFDEVFGYYLDKPYLWANPGHSTLLYEGVDDWEGFSDRLLDQGFTHVYVNLQYLDSHARAQFLEALTKGTGYGDGSVQDPDLAWRHNLAQVVNAGELKVDRTFPEGALTPRSILLRLAR